MKTVKLIPLLVVIITMMCSCTADIIDEDENCIGCNAYDYDHYLLLSFQDALGNDLVKGIEYYWWDSSLGKIITEEEAAAMGIVKPESGGDVMTNLFTLEVIFEEGIPNPWKPAHAPLIDGFPAYILDKIEPKMSVSLNTDGYYYLSFRTSSYREEIFNQPFAEKITFRLTCPYLFGDNEARDIVTWWELFVEKRYVKDEEEIIARNLVGKIKVGDSYEVKYPKCYRIEIDNKEFTDIQNEYIYMATLILDR